MIPKLKSSKVRSPTLRPSQYRPPKQRTKSISMLTQNQAICGPHLKKWVNSDHHHRHKNPANRSLHSKQVNSGPHTVNFDPPHKKQVTFDPNTKTKLNSIPPKKIKLISTPLLHSSYFDPHSKIKSFRYLHTKTQVNFHPHTNTMYFSIPTQKTKSIPIPTLKSSQIRSPT